MYNQKLLRTLEDRFDKLQAYLFRSFDGEEDLYSFIASIIYDKDYADCCEWKNGKSNPEGKELRDRVKRFLIPVVEECGGILDESDEDYTPPKFDIYVSASSNEHGRCYECPHKTDTCQEGLHCIRDAEDDMGDNK